MKILLLLIPLVLSLSSCATREIEHKEQVQQKQPFTPKAEEYYSAIQSRITNNWYRLPTTRQGLRCGLKIVQIPGGEVISAAITGKCNGDEATRRSMIEAVERTGSLPYRGFEDVFEREIVFVFTYSED